MKKEEPLHRDNVGGRPPFLSAQTKVKAIDDQKLKDLAQQSVTPATLALFLSGLKKDEHKQAGRNELSEPPACSMSTMRRYQRELLPDVVERGKEVTPSRQRALADPFGPMGVAAMMAVFEEGGVDLRRLLVNSDMSTYQVGKTMNAKPEVFLTEGTEFKMGSLNLCPGTSAPAEQLPYFAIPVQHTVTAAGVLHTTYIIRHAAIPVVRLFTISPTRAIVAVPVNFSREAFFAMEATHFVLPLLRAIREQILLRRTTSVEHPLSPRTVAAFAPRSRGAAAEAEEDDDAMANVDEQVEMTAAAAAAKAAAAIVVHVQQTNPAAVSVANIDDVNAYRNLPAALTFDGEGSNYRAHATEEMQNLFETENVAIGLYPAAASLRSQPWDRGWSAREFRREVGKLDYTKDGIPSIAMTQFLEQDLPTLGIPAPQRKSLNRFLSHVETIEEKAISRTNCARMFEVCGYCDPATGKLDLVKIMEQYPAWMMTPTPVAQLLLEYTHSC